MHEDAMTHPGGGMYDLFISYSRNDQEWVSKLALALCEARPDWSVWWDQRMAGGRNIDSAIDEALTESHCVIVVWSKKSTQSRWVHDEADAAISNGKLVPVLMEQNVKPPFGFRRLSPVDMNDWDGTINSEAFQALVSDIESRMRINRSIKPKNTTEYDALDELTNLPNRELFFDRLTHAIARAERVGSQGHKIALMLLDLDGFKQVNDTYGHYAGDQLLIQTAERIKACVRDCDTFSRLGGDEFTVMLEDISSVEAAANKAQEISERIREKFTLDEGAANVTASIGIALHPTDGISPKDLMKAADDAMYSAKKEQKDYQLYNQAIRAKVSQRLSWEKDLRRAMERNEYVIYYQPIYDIAEGIDYFSAQPACIEALVRWIHLRERFVPPAEFVPFLENRGLIGPVGEWVLRSACEQNRNWQEEGLPKVPVAVNISPVQILGKDFVVIVKKILRDTGLEPRYLQLEIYANELLVGKWSDVLHSIASLKELGVRIALDRFGSGCYPLSYLKDLPMDSIKIELSTVDYFRSDYRRNTAITNSVIQLAHRLKMECVAVGVENNESLNVLHALGVDKVQGELFSKPLCNDDFAKYWRGQIKH